MENFRSVQYFNIYHIRSLSVKFSGFECVDDAIDFIDQFGLLLSEDRTSIVLDRKLFEMPDIPLRLKRSRLLVESKRIRSVAETVYGGSKLPSKDYIDYEPFDSFDRRGFLKPLRLDDYLAESEMETDVEDEEMVSLLLYYILNQIMYLIAFRGLGDRK